MEIALNDPHAADLLKARTALSEVIDPELQINIIDMGLVYEVLFTEADQEADHILVRMTLSSPYCPLGEAITSAVQQAMTAAFPDRTTQVEIVWEPAWGYDRISEEGKRQLGLE